MHGKSVTIVRASNCDVYFGRKLLLSHQEYRRR